MCKLYVLSYSCPTHVCVCTCTCILCVCVCVCVCVCRVSVPRRSVQAPYQLRPHRRRSFDPSDSMSLNKVYIHTV